uniref:Uncharacterized protein n=1 Tax=viral metagenome TaxID=1070528 RepID=A0A6C0I4K6_9ZZZZ
MNLYVHQENQQMLWDVMNKVHLIQSFFQSYPPDQKEKWFKSVIQMFYEKYSGKNITYVELQQINQETISYILNTIQEKLQPARPIVAPTPSFAFQPPAPPSLAVPTRDNDKEALLNKQFELRQKDYSSALDRPTPEAPSFLEKEEDTAISNMDELIEIQRRLREQDYQKYAPPPPIKIVEEGAERITMSRVPDEQMVYENTTPTTKKNVTWEPEVRGSHVGDELNSLKAMISDLSSVISVLTRDVSYIKQHIDTSALNQHS